jgi:hypothetical protein
VELKSTINGASADPENRSSAAENRGDGSEGASSPKRKRGKLPGYVYWKTPAEARALIVKSINRMLIGDLRDEDYLRRLASYERGVRAYDAAVAAGSDLRGLEIPEKPQPPKLSAHELNTLSGAVRTWTQCKDIELEALLKEVNASNEKLLEIIGARERQQGGGTA